VKYNCGTCVQCWNGRELERECWKVPSQPMRFDTHPADQHPCAHGTAIVAGAVAGCEFATENGVLVAIHHGMRFAMFCQTKWALFSEYGLFCRKCGLRLPNTDELAMMYQSWQTERAQQAEGKDGEHEGV
jgi:hypothetical protein